MGKTVNWFDANGQLSTTYMNCTEKFVNELKARSKKEGATIRVYSSYMEANEDLRNGFIKECG